MPLTNATMANHVFLKDMSDSTYYPQDLVQKGKDILVALCERIEQEKPADLAALYALTHAATEQFNDLQEEFWERDSEIETVARDAIASDIERIAQAYGFEDADIEELTATRDW